jgi:uroporphyrin-III C-methyltransferase / precorrin-2 dehydrogenase / sirohydrochlorin ferrochelatase
MRSLRSFPVFVEVGRTPPLVIGGTTLAAAKVRTLLQRAPRVTVAAMSLNRELRMLERAGKIEWIPRLPKANDIQGRPLVVCALEDEAEIGRVSAVTRNSGVPLNVPDRPELCTFAFGALVNRGDLSIAIGTDGSAPVLATNLRSWLERELHPRLDRVVSIAREYRGRIAERLPFGEPRRVFWQAMLSGEPADAILAGKEERGRALIEKLLDGQPTTQSNGSLILVGAGPGDAELLTLKAVRAIKRADVILHDRHASDEVLGYARREAEIIEVGKRKGEPSTPQSEINELIVSHARAGRIVVRLKGGDGFIFGRATEELAAADAAGIDVEVVPGITTAQATAAELRLPLTSRGHIRQFSFVTGATADGEAELDWDALAAPGQAFAVYMGLGASGGISSSLVDAGASPTTRVIIVENATRPAQRAIATDLSSLSRAVRAAKLKGPAILLVGLDWVDVGLPTPDWVEAFQPEPFPFVVQQADAPLPGEPYFSENLPIAV